MSIFIGFELGSTRIKAVAVSSAGKQLAGGSFEWENSLEDGVWTYSLDDAWDGLRECLADLAADYASTTGEKLGSVAGIGISAMMHGYLVFDKDGQQLAPFRTWRNTMTEDSAAALTEAFNFNIPQRWSIAHLHREVTLGSPHVKNIAFMTTLAGYIHYKLTGKKVAGVGEASGMFPIDSKTNNYNEKMLRQFGELTAERKLPWTLKDILPEVLIAGKDAGFLTAEGARLLDPDGLYLKPGTPLCPPEGDAGTGMVATNAIVPHTGNVSAGTSIFAMLVLDDTPSKPHSQIDVVTTPMGKPVAMVHGNNCTGDLDAWVNLFYDAIYTVKANVGSEAAGALIDKTDLYRILYTAALSGDPDCGGVVSVNYLSGEHVTGFAEGRPMVVRTPDSAFTVNNFMRSLLFSSMATLKIGMDILTKGEGVAVTKMLGHGGLFKTAGVGQRLMAGALNIPVAVMDSAGEGGAWGIALLAAYRVLRKSGDTLEDFLEHKIFSGIPVSVIVPDPADVKGFDEYIERYKGALVAERAAVSAVV